MSWHTLSLALCLLCATQQAAADVRRWLDQEVPERLAAADIPAAIIAVVQDGQAVVAGYGADAGTAVFRVGSVSKPVTASVVLTMAAQGDLQLEQDLRGQLQDLAVSPPLDAPLTLHHLLTHTAGFNERLFGQHTLDERSFLSLHDYLRRHLPPRFIEPGQLIAYNDHHTALAAWVAERVSGEQFETLAQRLLFKPLGMTGSSFAQVDLPRALSDRVTKARTGIAGTAYPRDYIQLPPAAGLYTTAPDMARYMRALLAGTLTGTENQLAVKFRPHPSMPGRAYGFAESRHGEETYFYKDGQASGFNARLLLVPGRNFGLFVAHNRNIFGAFGAIEPAGRFIRKLGADLLNELWPQSGTPPPKTTSQKVALDAQPYTGTYRTVIAARHTWERLASLFDEATIVAAEGGLRLGSQYYEPRDGKLFENSEHPGNYIAFRQVGQTTSHVFIGGGAYERVPWLTSQAALPWVVGIPLLLLVITGLRLARADTWRALLVNGALILFFVGIGLLFWRTDLQRFFQGPPPALLALLLLPMAALAGLPVQLARIKQPSAPSRILSIAAAGILLVWLWYWNLLGYWLG